ncbi:hypothetical protein MBANPS3_002164, partial [Mucor bainieri]
PPSITTMTDITKQLPPEVWLNVFQQVRGRQELSQCRLVCRQWSQLAEIAMLSKKLFVYGRGIAKLAAYLQESPHKARLIRDLTMSDSSSGKNTTCIDLVRVAFTDNLEYLSTNSWPASESFYAALVEAAKSLRNTEYKLKAIPNPAHDNGQHFIEALLTFKDTLQQLHIRIECLNEVPVLNKLRVFQQLEDLSLTAESLRSMKELDTVLRNCSCLRKLELAYPYDDEDTVQGKTIMAAWTADNVEKVNSAQEVRIDQPHLDLVLYLTYKYPNLKSFLSGGTTRVFYQEEMSGRLLDAMRHIPHICVNFKMRTLEDIRPAMAMICSYRSIPAQLSVCICYSLVFRYVDMPFNAFVNFAVDDKKQQVRVGVHGSAPSDIHVGILDELSAMSDRITVEHLCMDGLRFRWWSSSSGQQLVSIYHVFSALPSLKTLSIFVERLEYKPLDSHVKGELEELDIENAAIDADMLPQLSQLYPNLYRLQLADCSIINAQGQNQVDVFSINMPHTSFAFLSLNFTVAFYNDVDHHRAMLNRLESCSTRYMQVTLLSLDMIIYCKIENSKFPVAFINQQEFELERKTNESVLFNVTCQNVARIHVMEHFQVDIDTYVLQQLQTSLEKLQLKLTSSDQNEEEREELHMRLAAVEQKHAKYLATSASLNSKLAKISNCSSLRVNEKYAYFSPERFFQ